ncbi:MAG TPA: tetratricopeptide repeat protein [Firmicutes bacterium]|jgi:tetratricopeptide (TPR) repeat protein/TolB-like protein|nr:tetratricopeptide repeat protein [Bacillota bacterium]
MKKNNRFSLRLTILIGLLLGSAPAFAQTDLDQSLDTLAARIVTVMEENAGPDSGAEKKRIAILDFLDLQGNVTSLGRFVAEELTTRFFLTKRFDVIERQLLNKVLDELKLSASGVVDASSAQELGNILGVTAVVSGTLSELTATVRVNARVIATSTGMIVAAASVELPKDDSVSQLLATVVTLAEGFQPATGLELPGSAEETSVSSPPAGIPLEPPRIQQEQELKNRIEQALENRNYRRAFSLCQEALATNPDFAFARAALGYVYLQFQPPNEEQALNSLEEAVNQSEYPLENGFAHYLLGRLYSQQGRRVEARLALEKAIRRYQAIGPLRSIDSWYDQAVQRCSEMYQEEIKTCWERQDYQQALFLSQQVIERFNPAFAHTAKAYSLLQIGPGYASEAINALLDALQLSADPTGDGWTYYLLGWAYQEVGATEQARERLEEALTRSQQVLRLTPPEWYDDCLRLLHEIYGEKRKVLLEEERYAEAIDFIKQTLAYVPGDADTYVALGYSYLMTGEDPDRAIEALEEANRKKVELTTPAWSQYLLGWAYQERERHGSAVEALGEALRQEDETGSAPQEWIPDCRRRLEESYTQLFLLFRQRGGNNSYYLMLAEECVQLLPEFAIGYAVKGYCLAELNPQRDKEALACLEQAQALKEDPTGDGWIYYAFGRVYQQKGEKQLALEYLEEALIRGTEAKLTPQRSYWYRQCDTLFKKLSKQRRMALGLSVSMDSWTEDPYLMVELGSEKGWPFQSFSGFKVRTGLSTTAWLGEAGGEVAWEGDLFAPTETVGWYILLGGGIYGLISIPESSSGFDYGFYFNFGTGLRLYLGKANRFSLAIGSDYRHYFHRGSAVAFGVTLGLPSQ